MHVALARIAHARSGDKGDLVDIGLFAPDAATYQLIAAQVTADRVAAHFADRVTGPVTRYALPKIFALKFVMEGALDGGAARSLRGDNLGKAMGPALLRLGVDVPEDVLARLAASEDVAWKP